MNRRGRHIKKEYERKTLSYLLSIFFVADSRAPVFEKLQKVHINMKKNCQEKMNGVILSMRQT